MSRLDFAPNLKEIQITDIKKGLGIFTPKRDKPVSFALLQTSLKKAGYKLDTAEINVSGTLQRDDKGWWIVADPSGQRFALEGATLGKVLADAVPDTRVEITGAWKTVNVGGTAREVISPVSMKKIAAPKAAAGHKLIFDSESSTVRFERAGFVTTPAYSATKAHKETTMRLAPIRTTTPGLTVYKGGAIVPRLYLIKQHLGNLNVNRQRLDVSLSYTPTQRVQLEADVPFTRTTFDNRVSNGSGVGLGNVTLWSKYRFYRSLETYGDRQAAVRFGLELPTGKKRAPLPQQLNASDFVRQQLTPINGGLAPHFDLTFSQARKRIIFGGNSEAVIRTARAGFRTGHEVRVNTDLEYVLLPTDYQKPGGELFVILETNFVHRGQGLVNDVAVPGSRSTEYYLSPGLQYAAATRFVVEGSYQFPLARKTGSQVLRTDRNVLLGVRYLF